jgi:hypothetical protein
LERSNRERSNREREDIKGKERITSMSQTHLFGTYVGKNCYDSASDAGAELTNPRLCYVVPTGGGRLRL